MIFKIRKGKHRNPFKWFFPFFTFKKRLKCSICLLGDHKYYFNTKDEQIKTNKLVGLSDNYYHRKDSIRIGYRFYNNKYDLMVYYYNNGEMDKAAVYLLLSKRFPLAVLLPLNLLW